MSKDLVPLGRTLGVYGSGLPQKMGVRFTFTLAPVERHENIDFPNWPGRGTTKTFDAEQVFVNTRTGEVQIRSRAHEVANFIWELTVHRTSFMSCPEPKDIETEF
jgi:hypothetical protein